MPNAPDKGELEAAIYRHLSLQLAYEMPEARGVDVLSPGFAIMWPRRRRLELGS